MDTQKTPPPEERRILRKELHQAKADHRDALIRLEIAKLNQEVNRYRKMTEAIEKDLIRIRDQDNY